MKHFQNETPLYKFVINLKDIPEHRVLNPSALFKPHLPQTTSLISFGHLMVFTSKLTSHDLIAIDITPLFHSDQYFLDKGIIGF